MEKGEFYNSGLDKMKSFPQTMEILFSIESYFHTKKSQKF